MTKAFAVWEPVQSKIAAFAPTNQADAKKVMASDEDRIAVTGYNAATADLLAWMVDRERRAVDEMAGAGRQRMVWMAVQASQVTGSISSIAAVSEQNTAAAEEVSASAEEMSAQVEEVQGQAEALAETARTLNELMEQFSVDPRLQVAASAHAERRQDGGSLRRVS